MELIKTLPAGKVSTYSSIAAAAGLRNGARQVARLLHSSASSNNLPWQRVVKADGSIALPPGGGYELQKALLESEGVSFGKDGRIDLRVFGWDFARSEKNPACRRA
jgi:methylated-DNA-protein-cysteine methyltransferase-like protein